LHQVVRALGDKNIKDVFKQNSLENRKRNNLLDKAQKYFDSEMYHQEIASLLRDGKPVLPVIIIAVRDILATMKKIDLNRYQPTQLMLLGQSSKEFFELKQNSYKYPFTSRNEDADAKMHEFLSSLDSIGADTLEIYQQLRDKKRSSLECSDEIEKRASQLSLDQYNSYDLLFRLQKLKMPYAISELFAHNIFDGWTLIRFFDSSINESEKLSKLNNWNLPKRDKNSLFELYIGFKAMSSTSPRKSHTNIETESESTEKSNIIVLRKGKV
jgi:hypothetical protein